MLNSDYQRCTKTVMDNIADPYIRFDKDGVCNYWHEYLLNEPKVLKKGAEGKKYFDATIDKIKAEGKGKKYDCILGLSGGVDSSYIAYLAAKNNLRPLVVHFDNGWNSEAAVQNIESIVTKLNFDLNTFVLDWEEFKDLQLAYLKASVVDIEVVTDHLITSVMQKVAAENKIKYILNGSNYVTEAILPKAWIYSKKDPVNIRDIHKQYGSIPIKKYPFLTDLKRRYYYTILKQETIPLINYTDFKQDEVKEILKTELGWKEHGKKHYESIFTKFYQGYILPEKFKIDKRKAHFSTLICSGQMTREEALKALEEDIYNPQDLANDKEFVLKKFGLSEEEFKEIMNTPRRLHTEFKVEKGLRYWLSIGNIKKEVF